MPLSEAQKRAVATYRKKMKMVQVAFSPNETDIYEFARAQGNMAGYIKRLIREDMEKGGVADAE
jgi:hypothetical protein